MVVPIESPEDDARFVFDASFVSVAAGMIVACDDEVVIGVTVLSEIERYMLPLLRSNQSGLSLTLQHFLNEVEAGFIPAT